MNNSGIVAIVAHDAGGAEILASYVAQNNISCKLVLDGPAVNAFKRWFESVEICTLEEALSVCDWCLCGTGWQSDLEWRAIEQAHHAQKRVVAFLDHWVNYRQRFERNGIQHLPDELWVGDVDAERLAREHFSSIRIQLVPNPYFIELKQKIAGLEMSKGSAHGGGKKVLFVSENISDHARLQYGDERYWGYTEFDAIEYFLANIQVLGGLVEKVVIRPHPSDISGKYGWLLDKYAGIVQLSDGKPLIEEIVDADVVVGCESMALVIGLLAQKKVVSSIPPGGPVCRLPQTDILHLREFVKK
ncbi:MAG: hypothetical protein PHE96_10025 [Methylococcales bacterium]|nr:hypothetical protein [Methylococcales bacterium]